MKSVKKNWETEKSSEINFWDNWLRTRGGQWNEEFEFRVNADTYFSEYFIKYLPVDESVIDVLDVGAGPLTILGKKIKSNRDIEQELRITCTDPLADEYMVLLKKYKIRSVTLNVKANSEELTNHFPQSYFDFVYMRNALDHSFDPLTAVGEMIELVKRDRYIILEHENNEAENENYEGLHQWNIKIENGDFTIWNKSTFYNVTEYYKTEADIRCEANETHNFIEIKKK